MKTCSKCNIEKEESEFHKKRPECKSCNSLKSKLYYKQNKENIINKVSKNFDLNKDKIKKYRSDYRNKQKKELSIQQKRWQISKGLFSTHKDKFVGIEKIISDKDGFLKVECSFCKEYFYPTNLMIRSRNTAINNNNAGEHRFYCSSECKDKCPIYKTKKYEKNSNKTLKREISQEFNQLVFEERNKECEKCGSKEKLQIHHIKGYTLFPELRFDLNNILLLCKSCHKKVHSQQGCKTNQLQCNKQGE